jgi:hypothetical protein
LRYSSTLSLSSSLSHQGLADLAVGEGVARRKRKGLRDCDLCAGEFKSGGDYAEILNGRWCGESVPAKDGRSAPYLTKIRVMGAFLSEDRHEFIVKHKRRRHWEIHDTGWS